MTTTDLSASVPHKQWAKLENEHHELAIAICAARTRRRADIRSQLISLR